MVKRDTRSLDAVALEVAQKINHSLVAQKGDLEKDRDARLMKVIMFWLEYKESEEVEKWLLTPNPNFSNQPPMDLINSEYATRKLMEVISFYPKRNIC